MPKNRENGEEIWCSESPQPSHDITSTWLLSAILGTSGMMGRNYCVTVEPCDKCPEKSHCHLSRLETALL